MIVKIIWTLIGINTLALLIFFVAFLISTDGRSVDAIEKGWMTILFIAGVLVYIGPMYGD